MPMNNMGETRKPLTHDFGKNADTGVQIVPDYAQYKRSDIFNSNDKKGEDKNTGSGTGLATRTRIKTKKPNLYRVLLLNDDFTPMEFVVMILEKFFSKNRDQATQIMLHVHNNGVGECGIFTYEVAETKVTQVMDFAKRNQHPLQCVMEKK